MMALKAVSEPMLMRASRTVIMQVSAMELAGMFFFGSTWPIHFENGRPLSRANANVWRVVDAFQEIFAAMIRIRIKLVMPLTPAKLTAELRT